jgi:hypothetical protein
VTEEKKTFASGAMRSRVMPRYDLVPETVMRCLADRLELGAKKYGEWNWQKAFQGESVDEEFLRDAKNHALAHLMMVANGDESEESVYKNIGGVLFGCMLLLEDLKRKGKLQ